MKQEWKVFAKAAGSGVCTLSAVVLVDDSFERTAFAKEWRDSLNIIPLLTIYSVGYALAFLFSKKDANGKTLLQHSLIVFLWFFTGAAIASSFIPAR